MKLKVYIKTSVISYLTSRPSRDLIVAAHQALTADWWRRGLPRYNPVISQFALVERVCRECGYEPPRIVTPIELMEV